MENQKIKKSAGRLSPTLMGDYDDTTTYRRLDWVYYGGTTYICKKNNTLGVKPSNPERWQKIIDEIGDMKIVFAEAEQLENITSGDKLSIIFGKIKKWFTHLNDIICRDNNDTKVTRIRADEGVQVSNRANDRHIPVYASDFVAGAGGTTGRSLANLKINDFTNYIGVLTNINQITSIGFWKIGSIDSGYAQSIGIRAVDNVGDFYAIVANYNGDGVEHYYFGNLLLFSPRLNVNYYSIQIWGEVATAKRMITHDNLLNTIEQISANTESFYAAGALAVKAMMADYNNKINQINSNMAAASMSNTIYASADIEHNAYHTLCSFTVPAGMNIVIVSASFTQNNIGYRRIGLSYDGHSFHMNRIAMKTEQSVSDNATVVLLWYVHDTKVENTLYLMAQQNSGITLNCWYGIRALTFDNAKFYTMPYEIITPDPNV